MMNSAVGHLVRRGITATFSSSQAMNFENFENGSPKSPEPELKFPAWGMVLLGTTVVVYFFAASMIEYTFGRIIPTLIMIESPAEIAFEPLSTDETDASLNKTSQVETVKPRAITSSFKSSIQLLQSKGGFRARFRGISVYIVNSMVVQWVSQFLSAIPFMPAPLSILAAMVLCANLSLCWTLIVISDPSPKTWFRRMPTLSMWKKVAIPTALLSVSEQVAIFAPLFLALAMGLDREDPRQMPYYTSKDTGIMAAKSFAVIALAVVLGVFLVIPANIALTRVQASLIPEAEETIVPFDRSFNGKVVPEIVGGTGVIGMMDAWKTFDWAARIRLVKAYVKVFAMQLALTLAFFFVLTAQFFMIVGKDFKKYAPKDGAN
ncbi:hypothetical protein GLAREA_04155 [Glarea lozoyensis ATCC 20868]|uniref:Ubiquitin carrier protein n=1 Tax=Glarea lozoyensis (strain ATCC 20868 / MF5171) TaxID=1116229 RepID=S3DXV9_GLAL2|nr:uncharacterized protein GLAREA_04155 [Glarea lozoyensis ATCC 20868]EPE31188.1 hypothetical protein GLAREA_04155 [Glarea lozoyensis ATCC 20868]